MNMNIKIQFACRIISLLICVLFFSIANAQTISVESFEIDSNDISASASKTVRMDGNDEACGLIKVMLAENDASFSGDIVGDIEHKVNQYWVYMVQGSRRLQLNVPGYPSLDIEFNNYDINGIKGKVTYKLVIKKTNTESTLVVLDGNKLNGHEFVDLGLSVKWATCNIGATQPYEVGMPLAWGEIKGKTYYECCSYFDSYWQKETVWLSMNNNIFLEYFRGGKERILPNSGHDAARERWGSIWRMPTENEYKELLEKCIWKQTSKKGQKGFTVTGPNGNSIFLPLSEIYWTTELEYSDDDKARILRIKDVGTRMTSSAYRHLAGAIRPVFDVDGKGENVSPYKEKQHEYRGYLRIKSNIKNLDIFIDGNPYEFNQSTIELPVGTYSVEIRKEGYKSINNVVYMRAYHTTELNVFLFAIEDEIVYNEAVESYNSKDYDKCVEKLSLLEGKNIPEVNYLMGNCYRYGITNNREFAAKYYKKAADQGLAEAQYELSHYYDQSRSNVSRNDLSAGQWMLSAALKGYANAQYSLAFFYHKGRNVYCDEYASIFWYYMAAKQGHQKALEKKSWKLYEVYDNIINTVN